MVIRGRYLLIKLWNLGVKFFLKDTGYLLNLV
jgi:hypothetical protein